MPRIPSQSPEMKGQGLPKSTFHKSQEDSISPALATLKKLFKDHYYFSDENVIDVVLGVVAGNHFDNDPLWLYLISAPSSGKTELLLSTQLCEETFFLSDFTAASLISGYKDPPKESKPRGKEKNTVEMELNLEAEAGIGDMAETEAEAGDLDLSCRQEDYSLLPKLNGKVLVTKDFSVIHDKPAETRSQILAILRDVYDGFASRALGNSAPKGYHSRFNYLAGMTPDIEKSWSLNTLGERFLMYRITIESPRDHARRALDNVRMKKGALKVREQLQQAVKEFMDNLDRFEPEVDDEMTERILDLAQLLSTCRTYVHREKNDDMPCLPQPELASRVGKQLMRVGQSVALVRGRKKVTNQEFQVMKRIALDSLPTNRRLLLTALWQHEENPQPLETFASKVSRISKNTVRRELDNLTELGVVKRNKQQVTLNSGKPKVDGTQKEVKTMKVYYQLDPIFAGYCKNVGGI